MTFAKLPKKWARCQKYPNPTLQPITLIYIKISNCLPKLTTIPKIEVLGPTVAAGEVVTQELLRFITTLDSFMTFMKFMNF